VPGPPAPPPPAELTKPTCTRLNSKSSMPELAKAASDDRKAAAMFVCSCSSVMAWWAQASGVYSTITSIFGGEWGARVSRTCDRQAKIKGCTTQRMGGFGWSRRAPLAQDRCVHFPESPVRGWAGGRVLLPQSTVLPSSLALCTLTLQLQCNEYYRTAGRLPVEITHLALYGFRSCDQT